MAEPPRHAEVVQVYEQIEALQGLILTATPTSVRDASIMLMLASVEADDGALAFATPKPYVKRALACIERAMVFLASASGTDLREFGAEVYTSTGGVA